MMMGDKPDKIMEIVSTGSIGLDTVLEWVGCQKEEL